VGVRESFFLLAIFVYDIYTVLENVKGVNRSSNTNDSRHDALLHCWLGRGSIRMTADMADHSAVGLGGALQYKLPSCKCIKHSCQVLTLTCNWVSRIVVILNVIHNRFVLHGI
jgi:hypothetical protein